MSHSYSGLVQHDPELEVKWLREENRTLREDNRDLKTMLQSANMLIDELFEKVKDFHVAMAEAAQALERTLDKQP